MDNFAQIAKEGIGGRQELLTENKPQEKQDIFCSLESAGTGPIKTIPKMSTAAELREELKRRRAKYAPFLKNYAPSMEPLTRRIPLNRFTVDGEEVTLPHYEGPVGHCKKVYQTEFVLENKEEDKAYHLCFQGADYYAVVYLNGICVGTHEGFFSPFSFQVDQAVKTGKNILQIDLYNDFIYMGNAFPDQEKTEGDKLYAATGLGWDEPELGWHHCPPGMGIYGEVCVEIRNRLSIADLFVRRNEAWIEVYNADYQAKNIAFCISIYGQNFQEEVLHIARWVPETARTVGMGDSLTEASVKSQLGQAFSMPAKKGENLYKIPLTIENPMLWSPDAPYLYQIQVELVADGQVCDRRCRQFGLRSFVQDTEGDRKGMFYLNGQKIRLRGANTMGFEQQDVLRGDTDQLIDDILLAKICNMNFLRLTQRPVQEQVYEYCDKLGMMTQTDLPLFGCMRRTKLAEGIRQAEEMERMVRSHPCNILVSYINEPFPNANNEPHRHLDRNELESFFDCCDTAVRMQNPDRVIKHVDGDYDPPSKTMPDNHCYPMWYNGHGIDIGRLNKGYWLPTKPGWYYGCGEYGAEGLDFEEVMLRSYPKSWLKEPFDPRRIVNAQTGDFYGFFYDKGESRQDWIAKSQAYQAFATRWMTEAFRRDSRMVSNAIHLFIDAWPAGWMKTIMDCMRNPKPAYFSYKNALEPLMLSLRSDRFSCYAGEEIRVECYVCNDTHIDSDAYQVVYELYRNGDLFLSGGTSASLRDCNVTYVSTCTFSIKDVNDRETVTLKAILLDKEDNVCACSSVNIEVFADVEIPQNNRVVLISPEPGIHWIAGEEVQVQPCGMLPVHFVSRNTGHPWVKDFKSRDFSYWYSQKEDRITPIVRNTFTAPGFHPVLLSTNQRADGSWTEAFVCAEKVYQGKHYVLCTVDLRQENPVAKHFMKNIMQEEI